MLLRKILKYEKRITFLFQEKKKVQLLVFVADIFLAIIVYFVFSNLNITSLGLMIVDKPLLLVGLFLILTITLCILVFSFYKMKVDSAIRKQNKEQHELLYSYVNEIKSQRHDFNSNLTTMQYLVFSKRYDELEQFLGSLIDDQDTINQSMITSQPELSALLFKHEETAKKMNILFSINIEGRLKSLPLSLYQMNKVLGNLLSNAIETAQDTEDKEVYLTISTTNHRQYFIIENSGRINDNIKKSMFHPNRTSKYDTNEHGYGLYIAQKIVKEANGNIDFSETNRLVICTVSIPCDL